MDLPTYMPPAAVQAPRATGDVAAARRAAQEFEGQVLGALLQPMFQGLDTKGPFSGGAGEEQWRPMLVQEFGRAIARAGGFGLSDAVLRQLQETPR